MIPPNYSNPLTTLYLLKMGLLKLNLQSKLQTPFSLMMMLPSHHYLRLEQTTHLQHLDPHQLMHKRLGQVDKLDSLYLFASLFLPHFYFFDLISSLFIMSSALVRSPCVINTLKENWISYVI